MDSYSDTDSYSDMDSNSDTKDNYDGNVDLENMDINPQDAQLLLQSILPLKLILK